MIAIKKSNCRVVGRRMRYGVHLFSPTGKRYHWIECHCLGRPSEPRRDRPGPVRPVMVLERTIKRYTAYFRGWCQTFGEHQESFHEGHDINWLIANDRVGLIMTDEIRRLFHRELLTNQAAITTLRLSATSVELGDSSYQLKERRDVEGMDALMTILQRDEPTHLYLTYHLLYPQGTRIVTFSKKTPLPIIYKEMRPLRVVILESQ